MSNHFIQKIEIDTFKCFTKFKADNFKQVNLIGGKNNIGKTALMEACFINVHAQDTATFLYAMHGIKYRRENLNFLGTKERTTLAFIEQCNQLLIKSNINTSSFQVQEKEGIKEYTLEFKGKKTNITNIVNGLTFNDIHSIQFIDNFGLNNNEIADNYSYVQKNDSESKLNEILNNFDPSIEFFKIINEKPQCKVNGKYLEITELGDGTRHLVSIITSFFVAENGYLFIDEIDNGIHYSQLDDIWNIIFSLAKKFNVQIFSTTHSKECIESFNRIQKKDNDIQSAYFELAKNIKTDKIFMRDLDIDQLGYELTHLGSYRGE